MNRLRDVKILSVSLVSAPICAACGVSMEPASDTEWKCICLLCDSRGVPVHTGVYPIERMVPSVIQIEGEKS